MNINTACKDCIFSIKTGNHQIGCSLGRLERMQVHGATLHREENDSFRLENKVVYGPEALLPNQICEACRNQDWYNTNKLLDLNSAYTKVRSEIALEASVVINFSKKNDVDQLEMFCDSLERQKLNPLEIIVGLDYFVDSSPIREIFLKNFYSFGWRIVKMVKPVPKEVTELECVSRAEGNFVSFFELPYIVDKDFFSKIDFRLNDLLEKVLMVAPDENGQGKTVVTQFLKLTQCNCKDILKVKKPGKEDKKDDEKIEMETIVLHKIEEKINYIFREYKHNPYVICLS